MTADIRTEVLHRLAADKRLAHQTLFEHRHPQATPDFHWEMIADWHSAEPQICWQAFRGGAKSSIGEEGIAISACFQEFRNCLILGDTAERAIDRLRAIKHEFETNEGLTAMFGSMVGKTWNEKKIVLANGVVIQAYSRGQSLRGCKHNDIRPDFCWGDDIENEESTASLEAIEQTMKWLLAVVIPALDIKAKVRMSGTPLHPEAMICRLARNKEAWVSRVYPVEYRDSETGERRATWPARYPLAWIDKRRATYESEGMLNNFSQEYMCKAEDPNLKTFVASMFRAVPTVRTWQPTWAMFDPARSVKATSAMTGMAAWSWIGRKMVVWDATGGLWMPDETVKRIFDVDETYRPICVGVEVDGLEEFLMQPLRAEQVRRGYAVPIRPMRAPKGKDDFIRGLQPFFKAGEIDFAKPCQEAWQQFLSFPLGRKDIPNALAYALMLRPGQPIYDNFGTQHVAEDLPVVARHPVYLALNATPQLTTAVLAQMFDGGVTVLADWVREGDPGWNMDVITGEAGVAALGRYKVFAPPACFKPYDQTGLRAACRRVPVEMLRGGDPATGREELRARLGRMARGKPAFMVAGSARWTLNALSGGYCREVTRQGGLTEEAVEGPYRTLMEGLEALAALARSAVMRDEEELNYAYTADGRRYISSRAVGA